MTKKRSTTWEAWGKRLERFPPILVRLLARDPRGNPLSTAEISRRCGLSRLTVALLSEETSWDQVPISHYRSFCSACGIDLLNAHQIKRQESYLNGKLVNGVRHSPLFLFLKRSPDWETYYNPLMLRYLSSLSAKINRTAL